MADDVDTRRPWTRWTPEEVAALRAHHARGDTFSEISNAIGRPRGSCIGKAIQLGLPTRDRSEQCRRGYLNRENAQDAAASTETAEAA